MSVDQAVVLLLVTAIVLANVPWIFANRLFIFIKLATPKTFLINLIEWLLYFVMTGILAYLLESKSMGHVQQQDWEFYAITFFMFMIFAFPGFIYRYNLKKFIQTKKN
jgi:predicted transporter